MENKGGVQLPQEVKCQNCGAAKALTPKQALHSSGVCDSCGKLIYFDFPRPCLAPGTTYGLGTYRVSCGCGWSTDLLTDEAEARRLRIEHESSANA